MEEYKNFSDKDLVTLLANSSDDILNAMVELFNRHPRAELMDMMRFFTMFSASMEMLSEKMEGESKR